MGHPVHYLKLTSDKFQAPPGTRYNKGPVVVHYVRNKSKETFISKDFKVREGDDKRAEGRQF